MPLPLSPNLVESKLQAYRDRNGRYPTVSVKIKPLDPTRQNIEVTNFVSYSFSSSVIVPVDTFSFTFVFPGVTGAISDYIQEGDILTLLANGQEIATGMVDTVETETTEEEDVVTVTGRDLLGQLEDQNAVNGFDKPIYFQKLGIKDAVTRLIQNTKLQSVLVTSNAPNAQVLLATVPGESKMQALQRFVEPLNCLFWADEFGNIVVGKPDMAQAPMGAVYAIKSQKASNVTAMKTIRAALQIPTHVLPFWVGNESVQANLSPERRMDNPAEGPTRLRKFGIINAKAVVVSAPNASDPQGAADVSFFRIVGKANILQAYAKRELARENFNEVQVQAEAYSHFNDDIVPFQADQVYTVIHERSGIRENMYLYAVEYRLDNDAGQRTSLFFCRLGTIVADVKYSNANLPKGV